MSPREQRLPWPLQWVFPAMIFGAAILYSIQPHSWSSCRSLFQEYAAAIQSEAFLGPDASYLEGRMTNGQLGPIETLQLRELFATYRLRDRHPGVWQTRIRSWESLRFTRHGYFESLAETMIQGHESQALSRPLQLSRELITISDFSPRNTGSSFEEGMLIQFPSQKTAHIGNAVTLGPPGTSVTVELDWLSVSDQKPFPIWLALTTVADPVRSDLRRIPGMWSRHGTGWRVEFDLSCEASWLAPEARVDQLLFVRRVTAAGP